MWSECLNSIMIFDGKLHEMITITFLKKMTQLCGKYPLKILEFLNQINLVDNRGNQAIKSGQLIGYNKRIFFFENHEENGARRLVPHLSYLLRKIYMK